MATYKERVAALKKAGEETKRKHAEKKAKKPSLWERAKSAYKKEGKKQKAASRARLTEKQRQHLDAGEKTRAKKKEGKTWTKATKAQKKAGGPSMNELIKARNAAKKGSSEYAAAQNQINKAYGSKKVHKAPAKVAPKKVAPKKVAPKGPEGPAGQKEYEAKPGQKSTLMRNKKRSKAQNPTSVTGKKGKGAFDTYAEGGKVESNPYGWPSRDARNGGKG